MIADKDEHIKTILSVIPEKPGAQNRIGKLLQ